MASKTTLNGEKILLGLLPYWDPMIPPQGISVLKGYLQQHGFPVRTVDANADVRFKNIYTGYFDTLARYIPEELRLNFFHMGHEVLQNHMMAHLHREEEQSADEPDRYSQLVKHLVEKNFFCTAESGLVTELNLLMEEFYSRLEEFLSGLIMEEEPGVVGFSGFCGTLPASMAAFKWIREHYPHIRTVFGGGVFADQLAVGSPDLDYFLEKTTGYIDKIIIGDGEKVFLKYLRGELPETQRVFISADITEPLSLAETPIPDMSDLNAKYYPYLSAAASRSCPFQCSFCNVPKFWGRYGVKDIGLTLEQMTRLYKDYDNRLFFLEDFLLNPIITPLAKALMESDLPVYWDGYLRVDRKACDIEKTLLWRRGGYYRSRLGVESGSQKILDLMGKKITPDLIRQTLTALANAGIKTTAYFVVGHPDETEEDFQQSLDLVTELKDVIWQAEPSPFRYYYTGQVDSDQWAGLRMPLYPEDSRDLLVSQTWVLDTRPQWDEVVRRVNRFVRHCMDLGVPNPYSLHEIYKADERWKRLHQNAVPSLLELKKTGGMNMNVDERKHVKKLIFAQTPSVDDSQFDQFEF